MLYGKVILHTSKHFAYSWSACVTELAEYGDLCKYMEERRGQPEHDRIFKWAIEIAEGM